MDNGGAVLRWGVWVLEGEGVRRGVDGSAVDFDRWSCPEVDVGSCTAWGLEMGSFGILGVLLESPSLMPVRDLLLGGGSMLPVIPSSSVISVYRGESNLSLSVRCGCDNDGCCEREGCRLEG